MSFNAAIAASTKGSMAEKIQHHSLPACFFAVNFYFQTTLAQEDTNQSRRMLITCLLSLMLWDPGMQCLVSLQFLKEMKEHQCCEAHHFFGNPNSCRFFRPLIFKQPHPRKGGFSFRTCRETNDLFVNMTNLTIHHGIHQPKRTSRCSLTR